MSNLLFLLLVGFPTPRAEDYNVYVADVLIGPEEPAPGLSTLNLFQRGEGSTGLRDAVADYVDVRRDELLRMPAQVLLDRFFAALERTVPTALILFVPILASSSCSRSLR